MKQAAATCRNGNGNLRKHGTIVHQKISPLPLFQRVPGYMFVMAFMKAASLFGSRDSALCNIGKTK